jgi:hypothetical protein
VNYALGAKRNPSTKTPRTANRARGLEPHKPSQYIRGQGDVAADDADQAAFRLSAEDLPLLRSATIS